MDTEAFDLPEREKHRVFVGPAMRPHVGEKPHSSDTPTEIARASRAIVSRPGKTYEQMRKRDIHVVIGGDYGFDVTRKRRCEGHRVFCKLFDYSPTEALARATCIGAELMDMGHELGQVREGYLADLLLVDGDPLADVSILQRYGGRCSAAHLDPLELGGSKDLKNLWPQREHDI